MRYLEENPQAKIRKNNEVLSATGISPGKESWGKDPETWESGSMFLYIFHIFVNNL